MTTIFYIVHLLAAVIWVGGMAFAIIALRPAAQEALEAPQRLALMQAVFRRFFLMLWHAVPLVMLTGWAMLFGWYWGFGASIWHVHVMHLTGLVMTGVFLFVALGPWRRMRAAMAANDRAGAAGALARIRTGVTFNLVLGLVTIAVAGWGRFGG